MTVDQLVVLSRGRDSFEREYGYTESGIDLGDNGIFMQLFDEALNDFILPRVKEHSGDCGFFTHWITLTEFPIASLGVSARVDYPEKMAGSWWDTSSIAALWDKGEQPKPYACSNSGYSSNRA